MAPWRVLLQVFKSLRQILSLSFCCFWLIVLFSSCYSLKNKGPNEEFISEEVPPLYQVIPPNRSSIESYDFYHWTLWAMFGNDDDGIYGERADFRKDEPDDFKKAFLWWVRNPFHNLFFYVIGSADEPNSLFIIFQMADSRIRAFQYYPEARSNFPSKNSCLFVALNGGKPFIAFRLVLSQYREMQFYVGWRARGNFGIKFNPLHRRKG